MNYPGLVVAGFSLPLLHGPFLYLYTKQQTSSASFNRKRLLHFLPFFISLILFTEFFLLPFNEKLEVFEQRGVGFEIQSLINIYAIYASGIIYVTLSFRMLVKYRKGIVHQFSNKEKINFNWLLYLTIWISVIWIVVLFNQHETLIFSFTALFVLWLGFFGIRQVNVFTRDGAIIQNKIFINPDEKSGGGESAEGGQSAEGGLSGNFEEIPILEIAEPPKYQKSSLSESNANQIHERLMKLFEEEKSFTNPDLTLNELAGKLNVHPNHLSQVINSKEKKTFYDLINQKRVEEFIKIFAQPDSQKYSMLALAYDCGFNSKASFNRNFKKHTSSTPSGYFKKTA